MLKCVIKKNIYVFWHLKGKGFDCNKFRPTSGGLQYKHVAATRIFFSISLKKRSKTKQNMCPHGRPQELPDTHRLPGNSPANITRKSRGFPKLCGILPVNLPHSQAIHWHFFISYLYYDQQMHNYFTNYHTASSSSETYRLRWCHHKYQQNANTTSNIHITKRRFYMACLNNIVYCIVCFIITKCTTWWWPI